MTDDRCQPQRPIFQPSANPSAIEATSPKVIDHTPSLPMSERLRNEGQDYLASLLEQSRELASVMGDALTPKRKKSDKRSAPTTTPSTDIVIQAEDIVSDEEFIRRTRGFIRMQREHSGSSEIVSKYEGYNVHCEEARRLFLANGGEKFLTPGVQFAQAFDLLRQQKLRALSKPVASSTPTQLRTVKLPGMPSRREWKARQAAEKVAQARQALGFDKP